MEEEESRTDECVADEALSGLRRELFSRYIEPHLPMIRRLCVKYSYCPGAVDDNYNECLINFYKYVETYDPKRPVYSWIYVITKRFVLEAEGRRIKFRVTEDVDVNEMEDALIDDGQLSGNVMGLDNYRELYNDDILMALDSLKLIYREALLLQQAGYRLSEIMEISHRRGHLKTKNVETVKSRLFLARQQLQKLLTRDGNRRVV